MTSKPPPELDQIRRWWDTASPRDLAICGGSTFRIAGSACDQPTPDGIDNPYWEIVRHMPSVIWDGVTPCGPVMRGNELLIGRNELTRRYAWAIPTPGDMAWLQATLDGCGLVEIGAGTGYWAWQASQAGIDVIAYEPHTPDGNDFVEGAEYFPLKREDHTAAGHHPDRALLLCWPSYSRSWAAEALAAYGGDTLVYVGEGEGGCCADDGFFGLLDREWDEIGESPHHITWWGIRCRMTAYRRKGVPA